ncbi:hypothetical protein [Streptomyces stackebrandtii]|uniref:hypothetical protein n=1 Tax=Streptomyces stackebrandtii TaxID=3051177 RepID=UPI0028DB3E6F|nr:hypothetical protein [Streptomyces sp. DSM 40976]
MDSVRPGGSRLRRRLLVAAAGVVAVVVVAVGAFYLLADKWLSDSVEKEKECCWEAGATPAWMSDQIGLRVPGNAADRRAGYKVGERYDTGLLSFTLPAIEAKTYLAPLTPKGARMIRNLEPEPANYRPAAGFAHLGLPEPETLFNGLLMGGFCPDNVDSPNAEHLAYCVKVFSHEYTPGMTRIYLRSTIEPGLTPPPGS